MENFIENLDIISFSYKNNAIPKGYFIIDCTILKNPWSDPNLRPLNGNDDRIINWLLKNDYQKVQRLLNVAKNSGSQKIAFGCFGGKHRSVAMVNLLKKDLKK